MDPTPTCFCFVFFSPGTGSKGPRVLTPGPRSTGLAHSFSSKNTTNSMSIIYLVRHADAKQSAPTDADRPLSNVGHQEAHRLGTLLNSADERPDQFVSSSAVRARQTAKGIAAGGGWDEQVPLRSVHALYEAEPADVLEAIRRVESSLNAVMFVGHEPGWSTTVSRLIGTAQVSLSTGTCVRIDSPRPWSDVVFGAGTLRWMVPPSLTRRP